MFEKIISMFSEFAILSSTGETILMVLLSTIFSYLIGLPLGIIMVITDKGGIAENKIINKIIAVIVNIGRSIPFIILLVTLIPLTRVIVGTSLGVRGMVVYLTIGAIPFVARVVETSLKEVNSGVVDAAITMGFTKLQIITKVYLRESIPSLIRGISITAIMLVGYSAMSGEVGGCGIGNIAIVDGYYSSNIPLLILIIVLIVILVQLIQFIFDFTSKKLDKKNRI